VFLPEWIEFEAALEDAREKSEVTTELSAAFTRSGRRVRATLRSRRGRGGLALLKPF
jgi:hypothetical protein